MRPAGLSEAVNRIQAGSSPNAALAEFVDAFDLAPSDEARFAMLEKEPVLTKDKRLNALVGAIAEYLAKTVQARPCTELGLRGGTLP